MEIEKLRVITNLIFDHIRDDLKIEEVSLDKDFYWGIPTELLYDVEKPNDLDMGQLSDDLEFLSKIENKEEAVSIMFTHLAPLLRYIGEKVGQ